MSYEEAKAYFLSNVQDDPTATSEPCAKHEGLYLFRVKTPSGSRRWVVYLEDQEFRSLEISTAGRRAIKATGWEALTRLLGRERRKTVRVDTLQNYVHLLADADLDLGSRISVLSQLDEALGIPRVFSEFAASACTLPEPLDDLQPYITNQVRSALRLVGP